MSAHPTPTTPAQSATTAEDAAYYREILHELIDIGIKLARDIRDETPAEAETPPETPPETHPDNPIHDQANTFDRLSRAIRRTILLARSIGEPTTRITPTNRVQARKQIIREVEDNIHRAVSPQHATAYYRELAERLESPEIEDDIANRSIPDIIIEICQDLGITALPVNPPYKRRNPQTIAALYKFAARPPSTSPRPPTSSLPLTSRLPAREGPGVGKPNTGTTPKNPHPPP